MGFVVVVDLFWAFFFSVTYLFLLIFKILHKIVTIWSVIP